MLAITKFKLAQQVRAFLAYRQQYVIATKGPSVLAMAYTTEGDRDLLSVQMKELIQANIQSALEKADPNAIVTIEWTTTKRAGVMPYDRLSVTLRHVDTPVSELPSRQIDYSTVVPHYGSHLIVCPYCKSRAHFSPTSEFLYHGHDCGPVYFCNCDPQGVYVGVRHGSSTPIGKLSNHNSRELRKKIHKVFDPMWDFDRTDGKTKTQAHDELIQTLSAMIKVPITNSILGWLANLDDVHAEQVYDIIASGKLANTLPALEQIKVAMSCKNRR